LRLKLSIVGEELFSRGIKFQVAEVVQRKELEPKLMLGGVAISNCWLENELDCRISYEARYLDEYVVRALCVMMATAA